MTTATLTPSTTAHALPSQTIGEKVLIGKKCAMGNLEIRQGSGAPARRRYRLCQEARRAHAHGERTICDLGARKILPLAERLLTLSRRGSRRT